LRGSPSKSENKAPETARSLSTESVTGEQAEGKKGECKRGKKSLSNKSNVTPSSTKAVGEGKGKVRTDLDQKKVVGKKGQRPERESWVYLEKERGWLAKVSKKGRKSEGGASKPSRSGCVLNLYL